MADWREHISVRPDICHGQAVIAGTRVPIAAVLDSLAAGMTESAILDDYPTLSAKNIKAAIQYAAVLAREQTVTLPKTR